MSGSRRTPRHRFAGFLPHLVCLAMACLFAVAATPAWAQPFRLGDRPPTPEEEAYLDEHVVEVSQVEPNALSRARAAADALYVGLSPATADALPSAVDNSLSAYFPPIRSQGGQGSCTCWAACYYYNTYTQARDEGHTVSGGNNAYICSPAFMYPLINGGNDYGASTSYAVARLNDIGCCSWATKPYSDSDYQTWPTEAGWVEALQWRAQTARSINGYTESGLNAIKQHLANGNVAATRFNVYTNFWSYPTSTTGINNRVYYAPSGGIEGGHAVTLVGYDDNRGYRDHRDGKMHYGAFLVANSWGSSWGWYNSNSSSKGYFWVAYQMFLDWDFGPYAYYNDDRPQYQPSFYAVTGINHAQRGRVTYRAGIGTTGSPEFNGPYPINQDGGNNVAITDAKRVAVDLTDGAYLLGTAGPEPVFAQLTISSSASSNGTITSADFMLDIEGNGAYQAFSSSDPVVTVPPGTTRYATAVVTLIPKDIYVDDSNAGGPWDGTPEHPFRTVQSALDAATSIDTVWVFPGTYHEALTLTKGLSLIGAGPGSTIIDSQNTGVALLISGATDAYVTGFTLNSGGTSYTAMGSINSTATLRNCVATGSRSGFGAGQTGGLTLVNCLSFGNNKQGVWEDGTASLTVTNMSIVYNGDNGIVRWGTGAMTLTNTISWGNIDDVDATGVTASHCDIGDGDFAGSNGNISQQPHFRPGPLHNYYLAQLAAGQDRDSPCLNSGLGTAASLGLDEATTRTDNGPDTGVVDMGYHAERPLWITDVYWDQAISSVVLTFMSESGVDYVLEAAEANAYADGLGWSDLTTVTSTGTMTTVADDVSTNPLTSDYRFYRIKRADEYAWSRQTAAVFELDLAVSFAVRQFFVSTPLFPDPDHADVADVLSTQLDYTGARLGKLTADSGLFTRATYTPGVGWANTFPVVAGEGYILDVGDALPGVHALRLTGTVPEAPLTVSVTRDSFAVTSRWMAYSMPRPTTLGGLGLETAITPFWAPTNEVRLLPLGTAAWKRYFFDGANWREGSIGGTLADSTPIVCGQGIVLNHDGAPGQPDALTFPTWYLYPPNVW